MDRPTRLSTPWSRFVLADLLLSAWIDYRVREDGDFTPTDQIHRFLDVLAEQFPDSIRVFRSASGTPLAFTCGVLLYRETIGLLDGFIADVLKASFQKEIDVMRQLSLEEADTYYTLFGAATAQDPNYSINDLYTIMLMDGYSRIPAFGIRSVLVTKVDLHLWEHLGFQYEAPSWFTRD